MLALAKYTLASDLVFPQTWNMLQDKLQDASYAAPRLNLRLSDFDILGRAGDGSFSTVILVQHKGTGIEYAIKIINKHVIMRNKIVDYIKNERNILDKLNYEGVVQLKFTFQDEDSLYMGMEYCPGGDLYDQIQRRGKLPLSSVQFYAAEVVLILEYLRKMQVIHRDLKPENMLLSEQGHLKLIDFGSAKAFFLETEGRRTKSRATSFVGTAEYVSPEVLNNQGICYASDLWALGCIIYQMIAGRPPFKGDTEYLTFQLINVLRYDFPPDFPHEAAHLVEALLQEDPSDRLGADNLEELKAHSFFKGINWCELYRSQAPAFDPPRRPTPEEMALDWELTSLMSAAAGGSVTYEYQEQGAGGQQQQQQQAEEALQSGGNQGGSRNSSGGGQQATPFGEAQQQQQQQQVAAGSEEAQA